MITIKRDSENKGNGQVDGLGWSDVDFVCRFAESEQSIKGYRDSALIRLMSDCLLRISEAVTVNLEDLQDNALIVQSSKTDQTGERCGTVYRGSYHPDNQDLLHPSEYHQWRVVSSHRAGRWKSPQMPAHYARVKEAECGAVARYRYKKG